MKTFQTAIATSLHFLKLPIILLALFFNFSNGEPFPTLGNSSNILIGDTNGNPPRKFAATPIEIGGSQTAPRSYTDIGGGGTETRKLLPNDIGGHGGTETRKFASINAEIGKRQIEIPIGGTQGAPRPLTKIGGNGAGSSAPRQLIGITKKQDAPHNFEIGGNGGAIPPRTFFHAECFATAEIEVPIGGQGCPRHLKEIGDTNRLERRNIATGGPSDPHNLLEIGGAQNAPRPYSEIGGGQLPPREIGGPQETRKIADIGGQQTAPRTFKMDIGGNSCPRC